MSYLAPPEKISKNAYGIPAFITPVSAQGGLPCPAPSPAPASSERLSASESTGSRGCPSALTEVSDSMSTRALSRLDPDVSSTLRTVLGTRQVLRQYLMIGLCVMDGVGHYTHGVGRDQPQNFPENFMGTSLGSRVLRDGRRSPSLLLPHRSWLACPWGQGAHPLLRQSVSALHSADHFALGSLPASALHPGSQARLPSCPDPGWAFPLAPGPAHPGLTRNPYA